MSEFGEPEPSLQPASEEAIQAVSDQLFRKKSVLEQPTSRPPLPRFPGFLDSVIAGLKKEPSLRAKFDRTPKTIEPPPVPLPDKGTRDQSSGGETSIDERPISLTSTTAFSRPLTDVVRPGSRIQAPEADSIGSKRSESVSEFVDSSGKSVHSDDRVAPGSTLLGSHLEPPSRPPESTSATIGQTENPAANPGAFPIGGSDSVAPAFEMPAAARSSIPRETGLSMMSDPASSLEEGVTDRGAASRPVSGSGPVGVSSTRVESPSVSVRNFFPGASRTLAMASDDSAGSDSATAGFDTVGMGSGSGDQGFGDASNAQGGASVDLTKTNELLRELVDVVKRQRDACLPVGGPSVYSSR